MEPSWANCGSLRRSLGAPLGASWGLLKGLLEALESLLGLSWGASIKSRGPSMPVAPPEPSKSPLGAPLGRSWAALGRRWGRLGALLGPSWGSLGQSWGHLGAPKTHRNRKREKAHNFEQTLCLKDSGPLGGPWGVPRAFVAVLSHSEVCRKISCIIFGYLEPSWRQSWAT